MLFGVLGALAVWTDDGAPVAVPGLKVRALLADLLVHEGRPVPADRLIDDLWGERPPGNPAGALAVKVSQLRRVLEDAQPGGRALVETRPAGYVLHVGADGLDAVRFQDMLDRVRRAGDPAARAALLGDALALWRGPALADFADEPFARAAITRLEELRLTALEDHAELRLALGEHTALAAELGDLVALHPLRERLRAVHIRALYRAGRQHEALESFESLRTRLAEELGLDPGAELVALQRSILTQDPSLGGPPRGNLPAPASELIGRDAAVREVEDRLRGDRLVTLTGPGGVGKTRLALAVAGRVADAFPDGAWLVELAAFDPPRAAFDPSRAAGDPLGPLTDVVMAALDIRDSPGQGTAADRLAGALRARRMLLVLDNCEHVVEQAAELADRLLRAAPGLRILATSREPLAVAGEVVWSVPPLNVPGRDADVREVARCEAVRLFTARASAAARGFALDERNAAAVAVLCRRLDGIPLALELAATRVRALGVHGLVARLDDRFRLLATGHRGAPPRQQTLMAMIDWSWDLLAEPERAVLRRLSVHADGCSPESAEAVCAGADVPAADVLDLLIRLVDRSLVVMTERGGDGPRYRLLESVAAYCADRLAEAGEHETVRRAHRRHYVDLAERAAPGLRGGDQARWLRLLDAETADLRAAFDGAVADRDADAALRLVNALAWYWVLRGRLTEARRCLAAALALDERVSVPYARATAWSVGLALMQGAAEEADRQTVLRLFEQVDDPDGLAHAQWFLAFTGSEEADRSYDDALLDCAEKGFAATGDRWGEGAVLIVRAKRAHSSGDPAVLEDLAERAARIFGELGDRWGQLQAAEWLGGLADLTGDYDRADRLQRESLRLAEELHLWPDVVGRLGWLGWIAVMRGDLVQARRYGERALGMAVEHGLSAVSLARLVLGHTACREGALDEAETHLRTLLKAAPVETPLYLPIVLIGLGRVAERRGDAGTAMAFHREALGHAVRYEGPRDMVFSLEGMAAALVLAGDHAEAARCLGAATGIRRRKGLRPGPAERADSESVAAVLRRALTDETFTAEHDRAARDADEFVRSVLAAERSAVLVDDLA
ncbi:BTAD domain-containing putative transcriptional regulator [Actinomadura sp. NPDC047616]|uniref:BTAD domain-containing putative transcriptional regulator n=1 Tax=Actinomadura sp. NPDC047616 TaxID=3155914 RepID=UPI0033D2E0FE